MKRVLILGSNGFLGRYLSAELTRRSVTVYGYDCSNQTENAPYSFIQGDFRHEQRFSRILTEGQFDVVYHLISTTVPVPGTSNILREAEENIMPTLRLLDAMKSVGGELIFASSGGTVYGEFRGRHHQCGDPLAPICSYGVQKASIEQFMQLYNQTGEVRCKICRISNPYGVMPQQGRTQGIIPILLRSLLDGAPITLYGETVRDYIYITDVIDALIAVGAYVGSERVFNVGTGIGTGLHALIKLLEERCGRSFPTIQEEETRTCDVAENVLDISETTRLLDWAPSVPLKNGIDRTLNALYGKMINDLQ